MSGAAIRISGLTKRFGTFTAVDNLSLEVAPGEVYGFLGLNGAGKTTTIRILLGLMAATEGRVEMLGSVIGRGQNGLGCGSGPNRPCLPWSAVGSVVESPRAYPELTVAENLNIVRRLRGLTGAEGVARVAEVMDLLKITRYAGRKAGHLSLGNAQRLGLARALLHKPEVLVLDEPGNGLDPAGIIEVRRLLSGLAETGVTIFVSSHILDEVSRIAGRIGIIHNGRLIRELDSAGLHNEYQKKIIVSTADNKRAAEIAGQQGLTVTDTGEHLEITHLPFNEPITGSPGNEPTGSPTGGLGQAPELCRKIAAGLVEAGLPPDTLYLKEENLEEYFMRLTAGNNSETPEPEVGQ